jgi:hypothetical protein
MHVGDMLKLNLDAASQEGNYNKTRFSKGHIKDICKIQILTSVFILSLQG